MLDRAALKARIEDHFAERVGVDRKILAEGRPLFTSGLLDSLEVVHLITFLDKELGVALDPLDIGFEELDTVERIVDSVLGEAERA